MEVRRSVSFLWFFVATLLIICHVRGQDHPHQPLKNVNLTPFWKWRSAYWCMQNTTSCKEKFILNLDGEVNVSQSELPEYCGGCKDHTLYVLHCIFSVHRHFWFANKKTPQEVADAITDGCTNNHAIKILPPPKK